MKVNFHKSARVALATDQEFTSRENPEKGDAIRITRNGREKARDSA